MSFLFPLYLLGALAIALPVLLHLKKRPPREKIPFGSLMFLDKSPEKLTRRTRIERWLLLALRALALLALALVFGRPFLKSAQLPGELPDSSIAVILVDRSASLQRENLAALAVAEAEKAIRSTNSNDDLAVVFFDREVQIVASFEDWQQLDPRARIAHLRTHLPAHPNGWDRSNPGKALVFAADLISSHAGEKAYRSREIILISDFIEGAEFDYLNEMAWPDNISVSCVPLAPQKHGNLSLALAASTRESSTAAELIHRVRIENSAESEFERFELLWKGDPDSAVTGVIPPGSSRVLQVPVSKKPDLSELIIKGDAHDFDNTVFISPPSALPLAIQFFTDVPNSTEAVGSPYFYLKRALHPTASLDPSLTQAPFTDLENSSASAIVLHGKWTPQNARQAKALVEKGRLLIALPGEGIEAQSLATLLDLPSIDLKESESEKYAMLASLNFEHPVLAPFARAGIRDFTKVRFWKHRELRFPQGDPPNVLSLLAKFDSGTPAWMSRPLGNGMVFVFLSGWEPSESQFALSSKFVPVLYSIFENAGYSAKATPAFYVGDIEVELPDGTRSAARRPGLYPVIREGSKETSQIGINLHPSEGRTNPVDPSLVLTDFNVPLKSSVGSGKETQTVDIASLQRLERAEKEAEQKLWKWFAIAVIVFLLAETWLSGRRRAPNRLTVAQS